MIKTFGFRGGEFGNWENDNDRQTNLNMSYDALKDLAKALNISDKDISLGGQLAIAYGARGIKSAAAHYEPTANVINLTKMNGAGSLGHEWGHALDHYIAVKMGYNHPFASDRVTLDDSITADLFKAMRYTKQGDLTNYYRDAQKLDTNYSKDNQGYWQSPVEMFARAFASYVHDKLGTSDYLIGHSENVSPDGIHTSPQGEEREKINKEFDKLIDKLVYKNILTIKPKEELEPLIVEKEQIEVKQSELQNQTVAQLSFFDDLLVEQTESVTMTQNKTQFAVKKENISLSSDSKIDESVTVTQFSKEKSTLTVDENDILLFAEKIKQNKNENKIFSNELEKFLSGEMPKNEVLAIGSTPNILHIAGALSSTLTVNQSVIQNCLNDENTIKHGHTSGHNISLETLKQLPDNIRNPVLICKGTHEKSIVVITDLKNMDNKNIFVPIAIDVNGAKGKINKILSVYGKDNLIKFVDKSFENNSIIAYNKEKANELFSITRANSPQTSTIICFDNSIAYTDKNVNILNEKSFENSVTVTQGNTKAESLEVVSFGRENGMLGAKIARDGKELRCDVVKKDNGYHFRLDNGRYIKLDTKQEIKLFDYFKNGAKTTKGLKNNNLKMGGIKL